MLAPDVLGVLAADLDNRVDFRVKVQGRPRLGGDFIDDHVCSHKIPDKVATASRDTHTTNADIPPHPTGHLFKAGANRVNCLPLRVPVLFGHQLALFINKDDIGADSSDINTQEYLG
jgi:hypothetical protein